MTDVSPLYEKKERIAYIKFNRPDVHNAMDKDAYLGTLDALRDFIEDDDVQVAVFTGAGDKAFTSGGDLTGYAALPIEEWRKGFPPFVVELNATLWNCPKPLIAAVDGWCTGWGMVVLGACDIRLATPDARFGYAGALRVFGGGGAYTPERLILQVPWVKAMRMLLLNPIVDAGEALDSYLITEIVAREDLLPRTEEIAAEIMRLSPFSLRMIKGAVRRVFNYATDPAHEVTSREAMLYLQSEDFAESLRAWAEKREPVWTGR